ncbi:alkaline phosphatase family protein [Helicovermis profundi]|uniref:2,3-bisphosphoglycerate-independent phosphoglycerate mutase ApgM2 n=1 Tax=Helicovermis profundi TaxID=3065157 RepID=A0AAU9ESB8_9FIRM|nr:2,3-bisphosphoglycerate-independent phosphoglycerate mutase ApgM2 [Clostridia bacterium S502]
MKTITLLLDGVGDRSYKELDYKTPLEYAKTPNLDRIAKNSQCGIMNVLEEGKALGTDLAHFILFGYTLDEYPGRAVIDMIGEKLHCHEESLILRISFASVIKSEGFLIEERFVKEISKKEIETICNKLSYKEDGYEFKLIHSYDSHGFLIVKKIDGEVELSSKISDSDPFYEKQFVMKIEPFENYSLESKFTAKLLNKYLINSYNMLNNDYKKNACNFILTKWAGFYKKPESFYKRNGLKGCIVGKSKLFNGISNITSMDYYEYKNFDEAIELALTLDYAYIHLHTKKTDEASHKKDPLLKAKVLEEIDKKISRLLDFEGLLIVTADHSTPCSGKMIHSGESVPFMAKGEFIRIDKVEKFDEISCFRGSIHLYGKNFMNYIQNATDSANLYHLRAGNKKKNYIPKEVNKLIE